MDISRTAILGSGIIGGSWAIVYARAGCKVAIFERNTDDRSRFKDRLRPVIAQANALNSQGDSVDDILSRISIFSTLSETVNGAQFVHECIEEKLESKKEIFRSLEDMAPQEAILASSTSSFPVSSFASDLSCRDRCIIAHPATPPHLLPVTEISPAPFTRPDVTERVLDFMRRCGQTPVLLKKEMNGFVLNRMQAALLTEMLTLLREGIIEPRDIDAIISDGFGLRWAFLGPLEGIDLNARGGIRQYLDNFGFLIADRAEAYGLGDLLTPEVVDALEDYARRRIPLEDLPKKIAWRDTSILALRMLKADRGTAYQP